VEEPAGGDAGASAAPASPLGGAAVQGGVQALEPLPEFVGVLQLLCSHDGGGGVHCVRSGPRPAAHALPIVQPVCEQVAAC
jgi:hypothetical protein